MKTLIALITVFSIQAQATIYFAVYDDSTKTMGMAYLSSGGKGAFDPRWEAHVRGMGMVGTGGDGLCSAVQKKDFNVPMLLKKGLTANQVALQIAGKCDGIQPYYRTVTVTSNGDVFSYMGPKGCMVGECGNRQNGKVAVIGGGLSPGVVDGTFEYLTSITMTTKPLRCILLDALTQIYTLGGEVKEFKTAALSYDDPKELTDRIWEVTGREKDLLKKLKAKMTKDQLPCM